MTEIGHAQRRLLDDDISSAGQLLPSTDTPYPSEISQPGSFPSIPNYPYQQVNEVANDNYTYTCPVVQDSYEATQLVAPTHHEYSTPATSNNVDSPSGEHSERVDTISTSVQLNDAVYANQPHKTSQRSRSMQSQMWSPHDTQPLSSVVSPGLSRSKSDNVTSGLMSPQHSEGSANDELALPMVPMMTTDPPPVVKKRGRPKKQLLPEDDEEDELAAPAPRNYFDSEWSRTAEMRRRDALKHQEAAKMDVIEINDDADEPSKSEVKPRSTPGLMVVLPVAFDGKSKTNDASASTESGTATKPPKKKKVKRSKTASAVLDKPKEAGIDDDVIWIDSNPLQVDDHKSTEQADEPPAEELPEPKKRGRKRKKTAEPLAAETDPVSEAPQQQPDTETAATQSALTTEENLPSIPEPSNEIAEPNPPPQKESTPANESLPHTPQRADGKENDPTTGKASHKGPTKHSPILSTTKVPYRVGLSKRARIAPLLKVVRK
jgi:hypothetical protein